MSSFWGVISCRSLPWDPGHTLGLFQQNNMGGVRGAM